MAVAAVAACTTGTSDGPEPDVAPDFDRKVMLEELADLVILPAISDFETEADELASATAAWSAAVDEDPSSAGEARDAAQAAWRDATSVWQRLEAIQIGPAGAVGTVPGGQSLRDEIYSWPTSNPCAVDQVVVSREYADEGWTADASPTKYGLDAIEYLLFYDEPDNSCGGPATINQDGSWDALSDDELAGRRAGFAAAAAAEVSAVAGQLKGAWIGSAGYRAELVGDKDELFLSHAHAVDEVYAALLYVDSVVERRKLGEPAGLTSECSATVCPDAVEHRYADFAAEAIVANLSMYREILTGGPDGAGFEAYLAAVEAEDLATTLVENVDAAMAAVEAIEEDDLEDALVDDRGSVVAAHDAVKVVKDDLKSQLTATLNLSSRREGPTDND